MSVIKNLRSLSTMEFYKNAITLRKDITNWMLRNFGIKRNARSITQVIKNIDKEDQKVIDNIFAKYDKTQNNQFQSEYPEWFINSQREHMMRILQDMMDEITSANSIYATNLSEFDERRNHQNEAIACCYKLFQEIQYIISIFNTDLNKLVPIIDMIEKEVDLLKGWRQSDNKSRKKIKDKLNTENK